jgi:hypothetical protein
MFFYFTVQNQILKLAAPQNIHIKGFTPEIEQLQIDCSLKKIDIPVVITYKAAGDAKNKSAGEITALEFVPKSFILD